MKFTFLINRAGLFSVNSIAYNFHGECELVCLKRNNMEKAMLMLKNATSVLLVGVFDFIIDLQTELSQK